jgi:pyruvate/2-oxoglutarate dehydrogenase complex dihydrolipoamide dehydrogenase (E3) component
MVGAEVTELIQGYTIGKTLETTEAELIGTVFPHPTISETMHEACCRPTGARFTSDRVKVAAG